MISFNAPNYLNTNAIEPSSLFIQVTCLDELNELFYYSESKEVDSTQEEAKTAKVKNQGMQYLMKRTLIDAAH